MAQGIAKVTHLAQQGQVAYTNAPNWDFLYEASTIKNPNYNIGDVVELPNGKGFVYCKSGGACWTGRGNILANSIDVTSSYQSGIDYTTLAASAAIGDTSVQMVSAIAQTEDGLRGGFILLKTASGSNDSALQIRGIIGNTACSASGTTTIYLDAALTGALTTSSYAFCMPSPYSNVQYSQNPSVAGCCSHVGVAAVYVSAADMYHWEQFKGRCWIAAQSGAGSTIYAREVVWRYDGSVQIRSTSSDQGGQRGQVAGYIVDNNATNNGSTEIMLTGNV